MAITKPKPFLLCSAMSLALLFAQVEAPKTKRPITGWKGFDLGMKHDEVATIFASKQKQAPLLKLNSTSLVHSSLEVEVARRIVSFEASNFIDEGTMQFNQDGALYLIRLKFNKKFFSYLSLRHAIEGKYGQPSTVRFRRAYWQDRTNQLSLDRNLVVRYVSTSLFPKEASGPTSKADQNRASIVKELLDSL